MRSILAVLALMVASAAGGFLYSEFLKQRNAEDMRAMRDELKELRALHRAGRDGRRKRSEAPAPRTPSKAAMTAADRDGGRRGHASSPSRTCRRAARTDAATRVREADAQRIALCGTVPAYAARRSDRAVRAARRRPTSLGSHQAAFEQDLGGARFTGKSFEYAQANELKAVCVNFMQWSSEHPHIARILVQYGFGDAPQPVGGDDRPLRPAEQAPSPQGSLHPLPVDRPRTARRPIPNAASLATPVSTR